MGLQHGTDSIDAKALKSTEETIPEPPRLAVVSSLEFVHIHVCLIRYAEWGGFKFKPSFICC